MIELMMVLLLVGAYFLPSFLCKPRKREAVFVINLFTGWTGIGWVVAMAIAVWPEPGAK